MGNVFLESFSFIAAIGVLLFVCGLYCIMASRNLIRIMIGMELLTKGVTLFLVLAGAVTGRMAIAQALVITLIVVEVVVICVAAGIVVGVYRKTGSIDAAALANLKG
jgi:NADH-quinone oxidoreductase subunit K